MFIIFWKQKISFLLWISQPWAKQKAAGFKYREDGQPPSTSQCYISLFIGCWNIDQSLVGQLTSSLLALENWASRGGKHSPLGSKLTAQTTKLILLREDINGKKRFLSGIAWMRDGGGGLPMPKFFGPFSKSAFLVNKKSLFLQKCQCIELLTVF